MEQKKLTTQSKGSRPSKGILSYDMINSVAYLLFSFTKSDNKPKGAGSFHIHRKTMKELGILAVLGIRERPNLAQNLVTH